MIEQKIYGRYEYPIGSTPTHVIFKEYRGMSREDERGITVSGLNVAIRTDHPRVAIILTYDRVSDTYMKLKLAGVKGLQVTNYYGKENV